jgi:hypothetical protein
MSTLFQPTAASRIKSSVSMTNLKSTVGKELPSKTVTKEPHSKSLASSSLSVPHRSGLTNASTHRVEQLLNTLASPPGHSRSLEETKKMIAQLPSTRKGLTLREATKASRFKTQSQLNSSDVKPSATPTDRLRKSKLVARSSPNLKSLR